MNNLYLMTGATKRVRQIAHEDCISAEVLRWKEGRQQAETHGLSRFIK
jgi:hypothetical protein